jgi:hypothetical protein
MDCTTNRRDELDITQYNGTRNIKMNDEWSPKRFLPISVTNGVWPREISQMPWSYNAKS